MTEVPSSSKRELVARVAEIAALGGVVIPPAQVLCGKCGGSGRLVDRQTGEWQMCPCRWENDE